MRVLLVNPPARNLSNRVGVGFHLPLGLLMVGGPIRDAGHEVALLDADALRLSVGQAAREVARRRHRSIEHFCADLQQLHDQFGVCSIWIADENWGNGNPAPQADAREPREKEASCLRQSP